ncbi:expressed unknown protein [Ectocarpus siliculosus]|uniref:Uncharacterized protein n=1 Tax=Ectocarpus siliculosus TaxID=2880 RepID=D7G839_ECTSI|nr:expressed unknown protein [Ectocarpus siliculosus]|eukprot:CBJ27902.1 expressed unknown protein [Ectocarpus siliculosus]
MGWLTFSHKLCCALNPPEKRDREEHIIPLRDKLFLGECRLHVGMAGLGCLLLSSTASCSAIETKTYDVNAAVGARLM